LHIWYDSGVVPTTLFTSLSLFYHSGEGIIKKAAESQSRTMIAPKQAKPTLPLIDEYCENYKNLFSEVRTYEVFKNI
jgi:hypothetical protein